MLELSKWYLDVVTTEGTALIAYAASLRWGALHVEFASVLLSAAGEPVREAHAWSGVRLPEFSGTDVELRHPGLGLEGHWTPTSPPVRATLLEDESGALRWDCYMPSAAASVTVPGRSLEGVGYVERLTVTRPPWAFPLRALRWGRYASKSHAMVWIDWRGGPPRSWIWLDGERQDGARVTDQGIQGLAGAGELTLGPGRVLCDRKALKVLSRAFPTLGLLPLGPLGELRELKRLDRGTLSRAGSADDEGWAVHEVVEW